MPKFSLIIATLGRVDELSSLLSSIRAQQYNDFEVIIVDQNQKGVLDEVVSSFSADMTIKHYVVGFRGAAKARNYGFVRSSGELIYFPDDDCEFVDDVLQKADDYFARTESLDVLCGKCVDREGRDSVIQFHPSSSLLTAKTYMGMFVEATMFFKRQVFMNSQFDESLGVGVFHGSEEGRDLVIRLLAKNATMYYDPIIFVYHPSKVVNHSKESEHRRVFTYRCGFSKLCLKHRMHGELFSRIALVGLYIPFLLITNKRKVRYYCAEMMGLLTGIIIK
ncbi:glycosyltransferase family 2 protein [Halopseudomonas sp.]|jgi:glycosyltransferase involved in cell wall biosynthesis|uniref:glycosyltransferase family 2 protein n=1 Tax=Halopseudomonas sp. TaxID=2901191 RepID=UPI0039E31444